MDGLRKYGNDYELILRKNKDKFHPTRTIESIKQKYKNINKGKRKIGAMRAVFVETIIPVSKEPILLTPMKVAKTDLELLLEAKENLKKGMIEIDKKISAHYKYNNELLNEKHAVDYENGNTTSSLVTILDYSIEMGEEV